MPFSHQCTTRCKCCNSCVFLAYKKVLLDFILAQEEKLKGDGGNYDNCPLPNQEAILKTMQLWNLVRLV